MSRRDSGRQTGPWRLRLFVAVLVAAVIGSACARPDSTPSSPAVSPTSTSTTTIPGLGSDAEPGPGPIVLSYETVTDQVTFPVGFVARRGAEEAFVISKDGQVWRLEGDDIEPILDLSDKVLDDHEQGMLGIALDPYDEAIVYLHYIDRQGDTVLSAFRFRSDGGIDPRSERVLLAVDQPYSTHNGGMLQFGPDGLLYIALGDGGGIGDPDGNGQNITNVLGGILRIDPDGGVPYGIPPSNSFVDGPGADELWVYGLRNPWRFWIDYPTETMYIGDVGQALSEEINVVGLDGAGTNFGWAITEGKHCYGTETELAESCDTEGLTPPLVEIKRGSSSVCAVVGGVVYRGNAIPALRGHYLYSDFCGGWLRSLRWSGGTMAEHYDWTDQVGQPDQVVSFGVDGAGEVYVLTVDAILKLVPG